MLTTAVAVSGPLRTGAPAVATVMVTSVAVMPVPLAAEIGMEKVPAVVGVPEMVPVCELKVRPTGKVSAVKVVGLFVAVIW